MRDAAFAVIALVATVFAIAAVGMLFVGCDDGETAPIPQTKQAETYPPQTPPSEEYPASGTQAGPVMQPDATTEFCAAALCDEAIDLGRIDEVELGAAAAILRGRLARGEFRDPAPAKRRLHRIDEELIQRSKRNHPCGGRR